MVSKTCHSLVSIGVAFAELCFVFRGAVVFVVVVAVVVSRFLLLSVLEKTMNGSE